MQGIVKTGRMKPRQVNMIDATGNVVRTYTSVRVAAILNGVSTSAITRPLKGCTTWSDILLNT